MKKMVLMLGGYLPWTNTVINGLSELVSSSIVTLTRWTWAVPRSHAWRGWGTPRSSGSSRQSYVTGSWVFAGSGYWSDVTWNKRLKLES